MVILTTSMVSMVNEGQLTVHGNPKSTSLSNQEVHHGEAIEDISVGDSSLSKGQMLMILGLNLTGFVWTVDQDTHHTVTVEFYDREYHRDFHFTDPYLYDKACLSKPFRSKLSKRLTISRRERYIILLSCCQWPCGDDLLSAARDLDGESRLADGIT